MMEQPNLTMYRVEDVETMLQSEKSGWMCEYGDPSLLNHGGEAHKGIVEGEWLREIYS